MPRININEIDNTIYSINELTNDNIVYVPGTTIKGEYQHPVLVTTVDQFERQFGDHAQEGSPTYDYVKGLLIAGLPVLFRRIVGINQDSEDEDEVKIKVKPAFRKLITNVPTSKAPVLTVTNIAIEATAAADGLKVTVDFESDSAFNGEVNVSYNSGLLFSEENATIVEGTNQIVKEIMKADANPNIYAFIEGYVGATLDPTLALMEAVVKTEPVTQLTVKEKDGGSYGNDITFVLGQVSESTSIPVKIYYKGKLLEETIISNNMGDDGEVIKQRAYNFFKNHTFNSVIVELNPDPTTFEIPYGSYTLSDGEDYKEEETEGELAREIAKSYDFIKDKYLYDVKFVSAGGYTDDSSEITPIAEAQVKLCEHRLDCFAILDIPYATKKGDVTKYFKNIDSSYAAAFAPWCYTKLPSGEEKWMSPSYLFLYTLGRSIQDGNMVYDAPAGVLKASMPQVIKPEYEIGGDTLDFWTSSNPQCINPLMKLHSYGYVIFGQNTLYNIQNKNSNKASALQKINVRIAINEVRRILFKAALRLTFQANNIRTWNSFKALVEPKLNSMVSNGGITDFLIKMDETTTSEEDLQNNTIRAKVSISVTKAVENFEIDFYIEPQSVKFAEEENAKNVLNTSNIVNQ